MDDVRIYQHYKVVKIIINTLRLWYVYVYVYVITRINNNILLLLFSLHPIDLILIPQHSNDSWLLAIIIKQRMQISNPM